MNKNQAYPNYYSVKRKSFLHFNQGICYLFAILCFLSLSSKSEAGLKIYFIRHAEAGHNVVKDWKDVPKSQWPAYVGNPNMFTPKGETQVVALTENLKKYHFDFIAVSPSWRTRHTILPYLKTMGIKAEIWPELNEYSSQASLILSPSLPLPASGILNGGASIELPADEIAYFQLREDEKNKYKLRSLPDEATRDADIRFVLQSAIDRIRKNFGGTEKSILLVGHGNNGKDLLRLLVKDQLEGTSAIVNTGMWMVEEQANGHFKLEIFNDAPYDQHSNTIKGHEPISRTSLSKGMTFHEHHGF
jgi:broad specificity phosphatase PhoE